MLHSQSHIKQKYHCTSPLAYTHCKLKWEKIVNTNTSTHFQWEKSVNRLLNTSLTLFQCTGYLHIQMLIQTPLSDSPHNRFRSLYYTNIQPNALGLVLPCFQGSTLRTTRILYWYSFSAPPFLLLMTIVNIHKNNLGWHMVWELWKPLSNCTNWQLICPPDK